MKKNFITGFLAGSLLFGAAGAFAVNYTATQNPYPVMLNGENVQMEGYNINDNTYFKLRDISSVVGGFDVGFNNDTIQLSKDGYVYDNNASELILTEDMKDYLAMCCLRIPDFTRADLNNKDFIENFIFYFYTGIETDLEKTTNAKYYGWEASAIKQQFKLLFGLDMPLTSGIDENGYCWIHVSDFGDIDYTFKEEIKTSSGIDIVYNRISGGEIIGTTTCSIIPVDNDNGFIITSILSVNNELYF